MSKINILRDVVVVSMNDTSLWTGRAKMSAEDLGLTEDQIPPEAVASLGSKRVIDKASLKPLNTIRYKMRRACLEVGTRFLGGFAVASDEAVNLVGRLNTFVAQGNSLKAQFMATLETNIRAWHATNPRWEHILSAGTPELERIERKITFGFNAFLVQSPENALVGHGLMSSVDLMANNLVDEICSEARIFVKQSLVDGRESGSQKTAKPMRELVKKLNSLKFFDPVLAGISKVLKTVIDTIPTIGKIKDSDFMNLCRVATLLADKSRFKATAEGLHNGSLTLAEVIFNLTGDALLQQQCIDAAPLEFAPLESASVFDVCKVFEQADPPESSAIVEQVVQQVTQMVVPPVVTFTPSYESMDF